MIRSTFLHLPGVGPVTEQLLWRAGVTSWEDFVPSDVMPPRLAGRYSELSQDLAQCTARLAAQDAAYFHRQLPSEERWRMYADFRHNAAFLDIETTGLSPRFSYITVVGILDSEGYNAYVQGENLVDLREALERYDLVVTFNGASFDLPYIEHFFGSVFRGLAHIDLRMPLRRLGYTGGLKAIERRLGVGRPSAFSGLSGADAVVLWQMWEEGHAGAKDTLVRYNAEDVASLPPLAEIAFNELAARLPVGREPLSRLQPPPADLPYDADVLSLLSRHRMGGRRWW